MFAVPAVSLLILVKKNETIPTHILAFLLNYLQIGLEIPIQGRCAVTYFEAFLFHVITNSQLFKESNVFQNAHENPKSENVLTENLQFSDDTDTFFFFFY